MIRHVGPAVVCRAAALTTSQAAALDKLRKVAAIVMVLVLQGLQPSPGNRSAPCTASLRTCRPTGRSWACASCPSQVSTAASQLLLLWVIDINFDAAAAASPAALQHSTPGKPYTASSAALPKAGHKQPEIAVARDQHGMQILKAPRSCASC